MVFSPAVLYLGISSVNDENDLRSNGVITTARVTDSSVDKKMVQRYTISSIDSALMVGKHGIPILTERGAMISGAQ